VKSIKEKKQKQKEFHTVGTLKSNRKIVKRDKIDTEHTHI